MRLLTNLLSAWAPWQEMRWTSFQLKLVFAMGAGLWVLSGAIFLLLPLTLRGIIYLLAALIGIGNAFMLVCIFPPPIASFFYFSRYTDLLLQHVAGGCISGLYDYHRVLIF